jgi:hypothetical protein
MVDYYILFVVQENKLQGKSNQNNTMKWETDDSTMFSFEFVNNYSEMAT